jgi:GntR family transcriptional regulator/MocR family aminotransferase
VTSASQWPTTATLAAPRRDALLAWANAADAWIVEDEYDGTFRYDGAAPRSLRASSTSDRVLAIGSFSMSTFPALRIGYVIVPHALVDAFVAAKGATDRQGATLEQAVLAEFMLSGRYQHHVRAMSVVYAERREALRRCLAEYLPSLVYTSPSAGLHGLLALDGYDDVAVSAAAAQRGVSAVPLSPLYLGRARRSGVLVGFGIASPGEIRLGVRKLREAVGVVPRISAASRASASSAPSARLRSPGAARRRR